MAQSLIAQKDVQLLKEVEHLKRPPITFVPFVPIRDTKFAQISREKISLRLSAALPNVKIVWNVNDFRWRNIANWFFGTPLQNAP